MMKSIRRFLVVGLAVMVLFSSFSGVVIVGADIQMTQGTNDYIITSPYANVDWAKYGKYKAGLHVHSMENGGADEPAAVIEDHYAKGYQVLALTDHDLVNTTWDRTDHPARTYLTSDRMNQIMTGVDRADVGMQPIPLSIEQTITENINTYFLDFTNELGNSIGENLAICQKGGGISQINHPGRYTGGYKGGSAGAACSNDSYVISKYADFYKSYPSCFAMEIINKKDGDSVSDRILWDKVLTKTLPKRAVWGTSNDDTHAAKDTGFSFDMLLMPSNTQANIRSALIGGSFYAVAKVAKRELGEDFVATGETPRLTNVVVDSADNSITIDAENFTSIEWIADGKIIATGNTIDINNYESKVDKYVRAQIKGPGGIAFIQPFAIQNLASLRSPIINPITDDSTVISGTAEVGVKVIVQAGKTYNTYPNEKSGKWSIKLNKILKAGAQVSAKESRDIRTSAFAYTLVGNMAPIMQSKRAGNQFVKGRATPFSRVIVKINSKIYVGTAQNNGDFSLQVKTLAANQLIMCYTIFLDNESTKSKIIVCK